jgi:acyl carrier protein
MAAEEMNFTELVAEVLGRDISADSPQATLADLGITSKELVILLTSMEHDLGCVIDFEVLAGLSTIESFEHLLAGNDNALCPDH